MPAIPATQEVEIGGLRSKAGQGKDMRPYEKQTKSKRIRVMDQVLEYLPSENEALSLIPSTAKKKKKKKEKKFLNWRYSSM
jgi:hypothetical protein